MAIKPGGLKYKLPPSPTPAKKKKLDFNYNWNNFTVYNPVPAPAPPVVKSTGQLLFENRQQKGYLCGMVGWHIPKGTWDTNSEDTKSQWELYSHTLKGQWESHCYNNNIAMSYNEWCVLTNKPVPSNWGTPIAQGDTPQARAPKEIRCLNRPGQKHVI